MCVAIVLRLMHARTMAMALLAQRFGSMLLGLMAIIIMAVIPGQAITPAPYPAGPILVQMVLKAVYQEVALAEVVTALAANNSYNLLMY